MTKVQAMAQKNIIKDEQELLDIFLKDSIGQYIISKNNKVSGIVDHSTMIKDAVDKQAGITYDHSYVGA